MAEPTAEQLALVQDILQHMGVKGMKWGVRRSVSGRGVGSSHPVSSDAARASTLKSTVRLHGTSALSNDDLQHLVTRLNLVQQHNRLNPKEVGVGHAITKELFKIGSDIGKEQAKTFGSKYAAKGIEHLIKKASSSG